MNNRFFIILSICVVGFLGLLIFNKKEVKAPDTNSSPKTSNHTVGNGPVNLTEFGDFQCPACGAYFPILQQLKLEYGDKFTFQFKHFPLVSIHPNAMSAHRAAEAAGRQGKFFEMHDMLYERQQAWSTSKSAASLFEGYAQELGLDMAKFKSDLSSSEIQAIISADMKAGQEAGASSTPTFVLEGQKLENAPRDIEGFKKLIDEALAAKQSSR